MGKRGRGKYYKYYAVWGFNEHEEIVIRQNYMSEDISMIRTIMNMDEVDYVEVSQARATREEMIEIFGRIFLLRKP